MIKRFLIFLWSIRIKNHRKEIALYNKFNNIFSNEYSFGEIDCLLTNMINDIKVKLYGFQGNKQVPYGWKIHTEIIEPVFKKYVEKLLKE